MTEEFGYIDETAELLIAEALNITGAEVHGVISFYHTRAPAGRHVVKLCRACQVADGDPLATRAEARLGVPLGTTTRDGGVSSSRFTAPSHRACKLLNRRRAMSLVRQSLVQEIDYGTPRSKSEKMVSLSIDGKQISVPEARCVRFLPIVPG